MDRLLRLGGAGMGMGQNSAPTDAPVVDTAEQVYISSLALLKMLKHGRAGMYIVKEPLKAIETIDLYFRCTYGSHGSYAGRIR